jgi:hypothetical protein
MSFPRKSFARQIITMKGYTDDQEIIEVMYADKVDREEAVRRLVEAKGQSRNRSVAQLVRRSKAIDRINDARIKVLSIAFHDGKFICSKDLSRIALFAGWSITDTGRAFLEICIPILKEGLTKELRDDDDRFIGYTITDAGRKDLIKDGTF